MLNSLAFTFCFITTLVIGYGEVSAQEAIKRWRKVGNPIIKHKFTADPAPFVKGDTLYLYTGIDYAGNQNRYKMHEWELFTTTDMMCWEEYPSPLHVRDFSWQRSNAAYASHVIEKHGKYYFYVSTNTSGIGVAVSDTPYGPFRDAIGKPLLTNKDCKGTSHSWACIDPAVITDNDGQSWIFWGNRRCFAAKLKDNMVEIDGEIMDITPVGSDFTEAPWVHIHNGRYYLTFACGWPENLGYAIADRIEGLYHFFYKGNVKDSKATEIKNDIKQAIGYSLKGPWFEDGLFVDAYAEKKTNVEGSCIFRLNEKDCSHPEHPEYILMYDLYTSGRYEFQRSNNLLQFSQEPEPFIMDFHPRHGTVIPITSKEYKKFKKHW